MMPAGLLAWVLLASGLFQDAESFFASAQQKRKSGDLDGALADYTRSIELDPRYSNSYHGRGSIRHVKGDLQGALADYTQAIELSPNPVVLRDRAIAREARGDLDGAVADCTAAIALDPADVRAYVLRGRSRRGKNDADGALADLTKAIEIDPTHAAAYTHRGALRQFRGQNDGALADYAKAIELQPRDAWTHCHRAHLLASEKQLRPAIEGYTNALELDPAYKDAYWGRAKARFPLDDLDGALSDCSKVLELAPGDWEGLYLRGRIHQGKGDGERAREDYRKALALAPADWHARTWVEGFLQKQPKPAAAPEYDNPAFKHWAAAPVGAWVKHRLVVQTEARKVEVESIKTLLEKFPDRVIVESKGKQSLGGVESLLPVEKGEIKPKDSMPSPVEKEGDEEIDVAGKKLSCHWIQTSQDGGKARQKFWFSASIPGGLCRFESFPQEGSGVKITIRMETLDWGPK